ncbi:MAG: glycosyltransferase family 4 protein [Candidatus Kaelpia imicola]|nr:glycosyltransferase family 4 protein [Candidatus Kaelpia imicola]
MKILLLNNHFNTGGVTSYILNLRKGLKSLGSEVCVASTGGDLEEVLEGEHINIPLKTKSEISYKILRSFDILAPFLKGVDLVHANTRVTQALARYINFRTAVPYLTTWHGYHRVKMKHRFFPYWGERVIAVSGFVREHLIEDFKLPSSKISLIYNGIDLYNFKSYQYKKEVLLEGFGIKEGSFVVSALGRLSDVKGFDYLLEAFGVFNNRYPQSILLLAGEGRERDVIEDRITGLGLNQNIKLLGLVYDIRKFLAVSDIFIQPSVMEGLGISLLEALAMGLPVIATEVGGIPEIVKNNYNGLLIEPKSPDALVAALFKLREDSPLKTELSGNAFKSVNKFSYTDMANKTYRVYKEIKDEI